MHASLTWCSFWPVAGHILPRRRLNCNPEKEIHSHLSQTRSASRVSHQTAKCKMQTPPATPTGAVRRSERIHKKPKYTEEEDDIVPGAKSSAASLSLGPFTPPATPKRPRRKRNRVEDDDDNDDYQGNVDEEDEEERPGTPTPAPKGASQLQLSYFFRSRPSLTY